MITFEGKSLGERQKELNFKVKTAAQQNVKIDDFNSGHELPYVDRLFSIDLASEYKDKDYFIEVLKCGDSLLISRALKWEWIYENEFSYIINPDYLHHNIFPTMSFRMKIKTLTTIAKHIRDEARATDFYEYCIHTNMKNNAYKFLMFTSIPFKQKILPDYVDHDRNVQNHKIMIGDSFLLADVYGAIGGRCRGGISDLSHLYSVNEVKYLNLFENHFKVNEGYYFNNDERGFGRKMSRSILKKHKTRILNKPLPYLNKLNKSELLKYSSSEDARIFVVALLPKKVDLFWSMDYYKRHKDILELVKGDSIYQLIKQIFSVKYPTKAFEMDRRFYERQYYKLMTINERESWALMHIEKKTGVIPEDQDYRWYEFVNFPLAFEEIKKKIKLTTNADKRSDMLNTLTKSAKTQTELKELLSYYYKRHVNERPQHKGRFLKCVTGYHTVIELDTACWDVFDKLLHSLGVYDSTSWGWNEFLDDSLVYHIINKKTLPNGLNEHLSNKTNLHGIQARCNKLCANKKDLVYDYIFQFLTDKIKGFEESEYKEEVKTQVREKLKLMIKWKQDFKKDGDYPEIALKFMKLDLGNFNYILNPYVAVTKKRDITEGFLIRCLKQDPTAILDNFSLIEEKFKSSHVFRLNMVLTKMRIYFPHDLSKQYLELCKTSLLNISSKNDKEKRYIIFDRASMSANIFAIFQLADEYTKNEFMDRHAPTGSKIEYDSIDEYLLYAQKAICRFHCYSRPPVALSKTALYLRGDYVHLSNDMFDMYLMELAPTLRTKFIKFLLNSPVSIQKRGLRLAFYAFETNELTDVITDLWNKTKNVSVRSNLYKSIVVKMNTSYHKSRLEFFDLLIELTTRIHQDDDEEIFGYFTGNKIPEPRRGVYLATAWKTVLALPKNKINIKRRTEIVKAMILNFDLIDEAHSEALVKDHVHEKLCQQELRPEENCDIAPLNEALWDFVATYILNIDTDLKQEKSLNVLKLILEECFSHWNETHNTEEFVFQSFIKKFTSKLNFMTFCFGIRHFRVTRIFEYLLESFEKKFGLSEIYSYYWDWKLSIITRTVIDGRMQYEKDVHIRFGSELGLLVKNLKERNCYYISFFSKIMGKISHHIDVLTIMIDKSMTLTDLKVFVAYGLIQQESLETMTIALQILPQDLSTISASVNELQEVIKTIKKQNNEELNAFMKDKYIYSDFKVRKIMF